MHRMLRSKAILPSTLEKRVIIGIGFILFWFSSITFYSFHHISSTQQDVPPLASMQQINSIDEQQPQQQQHQPEAEEVIRRGKSYQRQVRLSTSDESETNETHNILFPQSIWNEDDFETIVHPTLNMLGNDNAELNLEEIEPYLQLEVPKFWNPKSFQPNVRTYLGNYGERLMTPEEAQNIGSYTFQKEPKKRLLETIYLSIASYRDVRCPRTVAAAFDRAKYPERIRVGIVDQIDLEEDLNCAEPDVPCEEDPTQTLCVYKHLIDVYEVNATLSVGPVFARHIGYRMYRGEYFTMQTDAHMEFVENWDYDVIDQWRSAKNEMAVLSTYVSEVVGHYDFETHQRNTTSRPYMCNTIFDKDYYEDNLDFLYHDQQPEDQPDVKGQPSPQPFWAAGFSFARGHFAVQVPYDQYLPMIFQGEEISLGLRGFSYGYDFYAPERSVIFHYYNSSPKTNRSELNSFWDNANAYKGVEARSKARLLGIIEMLQPNSDGTEIEWNNIEGKKYGIGKVRTIEKFLDTFGIHLTEKETEKHLCQFVGKPMHDMFSKHKRLDGMGIDYDEIHFQFKDPTINGKTWETYSES